MLIAIRYEERDLVGHYGDDYVRYRSSVGCWLAVPGGNATPPPGTAA